MVWLKCVCHIRKTYSVIVPWTHIQPCPGYIYNRVLDTYNCALDTFYKRAVDTFKCVFTPFNVLDKDAEHDRDLGHVISLGTGKIHEPYLNHHTPNCSTN